MSSLFQFSLFQYHNSSVSGEVLNIALLVLFPDQRKLHFLYPSSLNRLKAVYPNAVAERTLKACFKGIKKRVDEVNRQPELFDDYLNNTQVFIDNQLFIRDASALQFGKIHTGILYTEDLNQIASQLYDLYLSAYDLKGDQEKHTDEYITRQYKNGLKQKNGNLFAKLEKKIKIKDHKFPFAWQNGTYNLVNPVSFDLEGAESIHRKATFNVGKLTLLQSFAQENNARFDLLLAKPKRAALFKEYDNAVKLLQTIGSAKIWEQEQLDEYIDKTARELQQK